METTEKISKRVGSANGHRFRFDGFEIDPQNRLLQRDGANIPINETSSTGFPNYPLFEHDSYLDRIRQTPAFIQFMAAEKEHWEHLRQEFGD